MPGRCKADSATIGGEDIAPPRRARCSSADALTLENLWQAACNGEAARAEGLFVQGIEHAAEHALGRRVLRVQVLCYLGLHVVSTNNLWRQLSAAVLVRATRHRLDKIADVCYEGQQGQTSVNAEGVARLRVASLCGDVYQSFVAECHVTAHLRIQKVELSKITRVED